MYSCLGPCTRIQTNWELYDCTPIIRNCGVLVSKPDRMLTITHVLICKLSDSFFTLIKLMLREENKHMPETNLRICYLLFYVISLNSLLPTNLRLSFYEIAEFSKMPISYISRSGDHKREIYEL